MARILLLADSNFKNNYGAYPGRLLKELEVKSCQSRKAVIESIADVEEGIVVIAALDMIAADIAKSTAKDADNAVEMYINQLVYKLVDRVDESDGKVAFGIVAPLFWTSHSEEVKRALNHAYKTMKKTPMTKIWVADPLKEVKAGADGTHLTVNSANRYIKHISEFFGCISTESGFNCVQFREEEAAQENDERRSWAEQVEEMETDTGISLAPPAEVEQPPPARTVTMLIPPTRSDTMMSASMLDPTFSLQSPNLAGPRTLDGTQSRLLRIAEDLPDLSVPPPATVNNLAEINGSFARINRRLGSLEEKSFFSNLMMATLKEEQDTEANKAMLNRITISGVEIENLGNMTETEKIRAMREKVTGICESLKEEGQEFEIQFVRHLNNQVRGQKYSVIEVKFPDAKQAKEIRAAFVKKRKSLSDKINISPVVRLATRVRIEIMHAVCDALKRIDTTISRANCLQFVPKPVIKYTRKSATGNETTRTWTFIDAVTWAKDNADVVDLKKARERAGATFRGTLAQHFVILE